MGDYTYKERQQRRRDRLKASGLAEVRERVPPDLAPLLKQIAAAMRDPDKSKLYRLILPVSTTDDGRADQRGSEQDINA